jgi:phosphopantetheinyl transferase (holo-ACP synthase)
MAWAKSFLLGPSLSGVHLQIHESLKPQDLSLEELCNKWPWGWSYPLADFASWDGVIHEFRTWAQPRQQEWLVGRHALSKVLEQVKGQEAFHLSHSHTQGQVLTAALEGPAHEILAIGVDFEPKNRAFPGQPSPATKHPALLEWVAREACFKALRRLEHPNQVSISFLPDHNTPEVSTPQTTRANLTAMGLGQAMTSPQSAFFCVVPDSEFWIVLAWVYANKDRPPSTTKV